MTIGICDDEMIIREKIYGICTNFLNKYDEEVKILIFNNGLEIGDAVPDILILDINMPEMNGIEVKQKLQRMGTETLIIYVTNYDEYMPLAFGRNVIGFVNKGKLEECLVRNMEEAMRLKGRNVVIGDIDSVNILYIQAAHEYCMVALKDGQSRLVRSSIRKLENELYGGSMVKIHRSYIVNFAYVECIRDGKAIIGEIQLPVSVRNRTEVYRKYKKYCLDNARYY